MASLSKKFKIRNGTATKVSSDAKEESDAAPEFEADLVDLVSGESSDEESEYGESDASDVSGSGSYDDVGGGEDH